MVTRAVRANRNARSPPARHRGEQPADADQERQQPEREREHRQMSEQRAPDPVRQQVPGHGGAVGAERRRRMPEGQCGEPGGEQQRVDRDEQAVTGRRDAQGAAQAGLPGAAAPSS